MKTVTVCTLVLAACLNSGCFYLVQEGQGGVAERYPMPQHHQGFEERLQVCMDRYLEHIGLGIDRFFPSAYSEIEHRLVQSRRLHSARYPEHALFQLQQAERMLRQMDIEYTRRFVSHTPSCKNLHQQELCI